MKRTTVEWLLAVGVLLLIGGLGMFIIFQDTEDHSRPPPPRAVENLPPCQVFSVIDSFGEAWYCGPFRLTAEEARRHIELERSGKWAH